MDIAIFAEMTAQQSRNNKFLYKSLNWLMTTYQRQIKKSAISW